MPVLATGRLVARVDPKHDRQAGRLLLRNLLLEPAADPAEAVAATAAAANRLAAHLGADAVETGDAMPAALAKELRGPGANGPRPVGASLLGDASNAKEASG